MTPAIKLLLNNACEDAQLCMEDAIAVFLVNKLLHEFHTSGDQESMASETTQLAALMQV